MRRARRTAAELYLKKPKDKTSLDHVLEMLNDPQTQFIATPRNVMKTVFFMHKIGTLNTQPESWQDLFFRNPPAPRKLAGLR